MRFTKLTAAMAIALASALACAGAASLTAEPDPKATFLDPYQAGIDYDLQGEYEGTEQKPGEEPEKFGIQVIALGGGKFRAVGYSGGLPGAGWDKKYKAQTEAALADGKVTFKNDEGVAVLEAGKITVYGADGKNKIGEAKRVIRTSPTLGMKPPEGAVVLFDGSSADQWNNGKMTDDGLLNIGVKSKPAFKDFTLHMEFILPFMPAARGQGRANSGCYLQDRYELQILDSFGLEGKNNECGGFYQQRDPDVNMCLPPLQWQTYDIDFTAARFDADGKRTAPAKVTVKHNGVIIHENFEFTGATAGGQKEADTPGPLQLQNHGNPVRFRNIWVVEKK